MRAGLDQIAPWSLRRFMGRLRRVTGGWTGFGASGSGAAGGQVCAWTPELRARTSREVRVIHREFFNVALLGVCTIFFDAKRLDPQGEMKETSLRGNRSSRPGRSSCSPDNSGHTRE